MTRNVTATDFFDPQIQLAKQAARQAQNLTADDLIAHGAELVAHWEYDLNPEAQLHTLERLVREPALKKVFEDGKVFDAIEDSRKADVKFLKLKDGSGVLITNLSGGEKAMDVLLSKADLTDLDLSPRPSQTPRKKPKEAPKTIKLELNGSQLEATLKEPKEEKKPQGPGFASGSMGAPAPQLNMGNPLVHKTFLREVLTARVHNVPCPRAENMVVMSLMAASSEIHPEDELWPEGITVTNMLTKEKIDSPKEALESFKKSLEAKVKGVEMDRDDVKAQFQKRRKM